MALRRGFKSEAAALGREIRDEMGLDTMDPLDPHQLALHLDIPILPLSAFAGTLAGARHFLSTEREALSALTVFDGHRRTIVHNDSHSKARQNSNLMHELSHGLLLHEPAPALDSLTGCRNWNDLNEEEADWLAGELLITSDMALAVARGQISAWDARKSYGVSERMLRWRVNITGAARRVQRQRR